MLDIEIRLTLAMRTPLSVGAGGSSGTLADKSILRDGWGRPIIPGSQVKGKARHAAEAIARALSLSVAPVFDEVDPSCVIQPIFGAPGKSRSPLRFNDLALREPAAPTIIDPDTALREGRLRPSASINRRRGVAEDERLLIQETTAESVIFENERAIIGALPTERSLALLIAALRLTTRWGGAKSRGLGWARVEVAARYDDAIFDDERLRAALGEWEKSV